MTQLDLHPDDFPVVRPESDAMQVLRELVSLGDERTLRLHAPSGWTAPTDRFEEVDREVAAYRRRREAEIASAHAPDGKAGR